MNHGCLAFYGNTSTWNLLQSLSTYVSRARDSDGGHERPAKRRRGAEYSPVQYTPESIYASVATVVEGPEPQDDMAADHIKCFFDTVSHIVPILDSLGFSSTYCSFLPPSVLNLTTRDEALQKQCLVYSVLALGALYSVTGSTISGRAANYYSGAQSLLGRLFGHDCLELVQATLFMV
jgi:hypothetical protein